MDLRGSKWQEAEEEWIMKSITPAVHQILLR
jgi:hypothetical protein